MQVQVQDITKRIQEIAAKGYRRVRGDAGEVEMYALKELLEAEQYLRSVSGKPKLHLAKVVPPGTV